jgi:hypothetical protein
MSDSDTATDGREHGYIIGEAESAAALEDSTAGDYFCSPRAVSPSDDEWAELVNGLVTLVQQERGGSSDTEKDQTPE